MQNIILTWHIIITVAKLQSFSLDRNANNSKVCTNQIVLNSQQILQFTSNSD